MQRIVDELREDLSAFIEQREVLTLVLWASNPTDLLYAIKLLGAMDEASPRDIFIPFAEDCFDVGGYLDSLMAACDMELEAANEAIRQGLGDADAEPWESLPGACFDQRRRPVERIQALVAHIRRYYADPAHRVVLALLPMQLSNGAAYRELANALIPRRGYEPWMAGVRIILHDSRRAPLFTRELVEGDVFGTLIRPIDFSHEAMVKSLVDTASDRETPVDERMKSFLQVAALDHAWGRHEEAIQKYGVAYRYYIGTGDVPLQGVCLLFVGYSLEQLGRRVEASEKYRQALELSIANQIKQLMLNALMALGGLHQRDADWRDAAQYWETAAFVAKDTANPYAIVDSAKNAGVCQIALNDTKRALELWDAAKTVAQQVGYWPGAVTVLSYMVDIERRGGMDGPRAQHERELAVAQAEAGHQQREIVAAQAATGLGGQSA